MPEREVYNEKNFIFAFYRFAAAFGTARRRFRGAGAGPSGECPGAAGDEGDRFC